MGFFQSIVHLVGFVAPALALALLMPAAARLLRLGPARPQRYWVQALLCLGAGLAALSVGLWWFGRDGKIASYGALVLVVASAQWLMAGGWRR